MAPAEPKTIVYICDWLPPEYGAVGQYSDLFARQLAAEGHKVVLGGLTTGEASQTRETIGAGSLSTIKLKARAYEKSRFVQRLLWTAQINTRLIQAMWRHMRSADEVLFTGSPPLMLHWIAPANILLRKTLVYRITDFHPECLMAATRPSAALNLLYKLTLFWRRRVHRFEVLGEDQRARLADIGIARDRVVLKRDPSPVEIAPDTKPLARPAGADGKLLLLYSGNWGVAHDVDTFVSAYRKHHREGSGRFMLWLNAVGAKAGAVEAALVADGLPLIRSSPVPLDDLASLLVTPDAHLITLLDPFVGFVLPSKVYGCVASGLPVLYVGSEKSDVHLLCERDVAEGAYQRAGAGDVEACFAALERLAGQIDRGRQSENSDIAAQHRRAGDGN